MERLSKADTRNRPYLQAAMVADHLRKVDMTDRQLHKMAMAADHHHNKADMRNHPSQPVATAAARQDTKAKAATAKAADTAETHTAQLHHNTADKEATAAWVGTTAQTQTQAAAPSSATHPPARRSTNNKQ